MRTQRALSKRRPSTESVRPFQDAERVVRLILQEATTSLPKAGRIIGKLIVLALLGFLLASNCCLSGYLVPVGVFTLAICAGWLDAVGNECKRHRFFPHKSLNVAGSYLFRWQWVVVWAGILFVLSSVGLLHVQERLWKISILAVVPLALMLVGRAVEPYQFRRARNDVQRAELIVRQLVATEKPSDISALAPLIDLDQIPLYKLGSVAKLLYTFAVNYEASDKAAVDLAAGETPLQTSLLSKLLSAAYFPFRVIASDLFLWESRDLVTISVGAVYFALVYLGWSYFVWAPLCAVVPFLGPKSKAARYVRALQENIRLVQGVAAEKHGSMTPTCTTQDTPSINWPMMGYISYIHIQALYTVVIVVFFGGSCPLFGQATPMKMETYLLAFALYLCSALGITAGVHRLWAHKSYKAGLPLRFLLMIFNSIANQGSIFHWARDHRVHHLYSDTTADPHNANRGFWFSHVGWLLFKKHPAVREAGKHINMNDLKSDPIVMFQERADPFWNLMWCFGFPAFTSLLWGDTLWNGFLLAGVLRYVLLLNATWAVNSVVHSWGSKPYNPSHRTTENGWVSVFAIGEGWHNWHHAFCWDYAAAELGALYQFNPTKMFIDTMAFLGLAWDRKRADQVWAQRKARWELAQGRPVLESLEGPPLFQYRVVTFGPEYEDHDGHEESHDAGTQQSEQ